MMKNKKWMALVALLAALAGLIGLIVCITPSQTAADKTVSQYVAAINKANTEKMHKLDASTVLSDALGGLVSGLGSSYDESLEDYGDDKIYGALQLSTFSAAGYLPDNVEKIKSVKLVGCVDGEQSSYLGLTGMNVFAVLEIVYEDTDGQTQSMYCNESIGLLLYKNNYYIIG